MTADRLDQLSDKQRLCLRLVAQLKTSKQIAAELGISPHTVDGHIAAAIAKLGASDRADAARILLSGEQGTPEPLTGQSPPVVKTPDPIEPAPHPAAQPAAPQGRIIKLDPWTRLGIIVALAIGLVFAGVLTAVGGDVIYRHYRQTPDTHHHISP